MVLKDYLTDLSLLAWLDGQISQDALYGITVIPLLILFYQDFTNRECLGKMQGGFVDNYLLYQFSCTKTSKNYLLY